MLRPSEAAARYAVYFAPPPGSVLESVGAAWLGRSVWEGAAAARPTVPGLGARRLRDLTAGPRSYGFHATLKAPFRLADSLDEAALCEAAALFARSAASFPLPTLKIGVLSGFIALLPENRSAELERLAADCVKAFERFRAPPTATERARRRPDRLSPRQVSYLDAWGYPFVLEEYRFHMTLTAKVGSDEREILLPLLEWLFSPALTEPSAFDGISLFRQAAPDQPFEALRRFPFRPPVTVPG